MKFYSINQAAEILNIHPKTLGRYIREKRIHAGKIGKSWRITEDDLQVFINKNLKPQTGGENLTGATNAPDIDQPRIKVTSVIDIQVKSQDEANRIANTMTALLNSKDPSMGMSRFHSVYDPTQSLVKLVIWGSPKLISDLLVLLERFEDQ